MLVFALDADTAGQQQWQALARQTALRGKRVAAVPVAANGGCKDVSEAWTAGVLTVGPASDHGRKGTRGVSHVGHPPMLATLHAVPHTALLCLT